MGRIALTSNSLKLAQLSVTAIDWILLKVLRDLGDLTSLKYFAFTESGEEFEGNLDEYGRTGRITSATEEYANFFVGGGDWVLSEDETYIEQDDYLCSDDFDNLDKE